MRRSRCCLSLALIVLTLFFLSIFPPPPLPGTSVIVVDLAKVVDIGEVGRDANNGGDDEDGDHGGYVVGYDEEEKEDSADCFYIVAAVPHKSWV